MRDHRLVAELIDLLGEEALIRLAEEHAGIRLYIPSNPERSQLVKTLGADIANKLSRRYGGDYISVPLVRELRARLYRQHHGLSNAGIARKLGITESGVERLFQRSPVKYLAKKSDDRQIEMFPKDQA